MSVSPDPASILITPPPEWNGNNPDLAQDIINPPRVALTPPDAQRAKDTLVEWSKSSVLLGKKAALRAVIGKITPTNVYLVQIKSWLEQRVLNVKVDPHPGPADVSGYDPPNRWSIDIKVPEKYCTTLEERSVYDVPNSVKIYACETCKGVGGKKCEKKHENNKVCTLCDNANWINCEPCKGLKFKRSYLILQVNFYCFSKTVAINGDGSPSIVPVSYLSGENLLLKAENKTLNPGELSKKQPQLLPGALSVIPTILASLQNQTGDPEGKLASRLVSYSCSEIQMIKVEYTDLDHPHEFYMMASKVFSDDYSQNCFACHVPAGNKIRESKCLII